jgi:mevalonate kinase
MKNNGVTVSAPGKLLLLGDHAVVYGFPCIVTAVNTRIVATVKSIEESAFELDAPDVNVHGYKKPMSEIGTGDVSKDAKFAEFTVKNYFKTFPFSGGISIHTQAQFSKSIGFGSSAATVVSILAALVKLFHPSVSEKQLFLLAKKTVLDVQHAGSGFDAAAALYGGTILFENHGEVVEPLSVQSMPLVVGYTGVKADTATIVGAVAQKREKEKVKVDRIFEAIGKLVEEAKDRMVEGDWERVGRLMDFNQEYLRDLGVSSEKLESLISAAKKAGAWGAKLSGAGGGDCMIAVASQDKRQNVVDAIVEAGGTVMDITTGEQGVRLETNNAEAKA